jgi:hypothetical protein
MMSPIKRSPASRSSAKDRAGSAFNTFPYRSQPDRREMDFQAVNRAAIAALPAVLARIVPGGKILGREYTALNPTRADRRPGSFKVNLRTGRWADFATGDKGGDPVSRCAYVEGVSQAEAARRLARMLSLDTREGRRHG